MLNKLLNKLSSKVSYFFWSASKKISRKGIYEFLEKEFSEIEKGSKILNVGAGGKIEELLQQYAQLRDYSIESFDIDPNRGPDIQGDICVYNFNDTDIYDCVVLSEVLEHLHSPHLAINQIFNILKPKGKLIITVPFILPIHERPYDYYRYSKYGLEFLLKNFKNVQIKERNSWSEAISVLMVRLLMAKQNRFPFIPYLLIVLVYLFNPFILLLGKVYKTDFMTTGYLVTASK
jgi:SAM-dependent methyltransferase